MFPILLAFAKTKLGRQILAGGAILLALAVAYGILRHRLVERGKELGRAEQLEVDKQSWEQDRAAYVGALREQGAQISKARELIIQYQAALVAAKAKIDAIEGEKDSALLAVSRIPDAGLLADIRSRLYPVLAAESVLRKNGVDSGSPPLSPTELRACDSCLAELPLAQRQISGLREMLGALEGKSAAQQSALTATEAQRDAAIGYANRLEGHYVAAYNLAQKVRRRPLILKILTFGLLKDPKVNLPSPVSLKTEN